VKYEDIDSISDVIQYLDGGNTLTGSQAFALSKKLNIDSRRIERLIEGRKQVSDRQQQREFAEANAVTGPEIVGVNDIDDIARLAGQGKTFSEYQIWALSKSLQVSEGEVNNAIEQGYAQVEGDVADGFAGRLTGIGGGTGYIGGKPGDTLGGVGPLLDPDTVSFVSPLSEEDLDAIPPAPQYIFGSPGGKSIEFAKYRGTDDGELSPVLPLNYEDTIAYLIGIGVNVKFLGLDSPGYPLGYKARQEGGTIAEDKYGDYPVYLPDMADSIFGQFISSDTEIISLQRKLVNAGYLTTTFDPGRFDEATELAVETAMGVHNSEGRTPNVPEIAGALLDFYGVDTEGNAVDPTVYGFTPERAREIKQFFMNELDVDIEQEDQRIRADLVVEAPRIDEEQAAYTMLQMIQQQYGSMGVRYDNIKNASTLVNKLLKDVAVESKQKEKDSIAASKAAAEAALDKQTRIDLYRRSNPNLSDDELALLYPDVFAMETVDVVGELGPFGSGAGNFRENLFANRLSRSIESLLKPELELDEQRNALNQATANFYRAARGARNLVQGAPSLNRGINT
jgi:hypothetical protein